MNKHLKHFIVGFTVMLFLLLGFALIGFVIVCAIKSYEWWCLLAFLPIPIVMIVCSIMQFGASLCGDLNDLGH